MKLRKTSRAVLINGRNEVLLQKIIPLDTEKYGKECWIAPGGQIEKDESVVECAIRELYEETGINVSGTEKILWHGSHILKLDGEYTLFDEHFVLIRVNAGHQATSGDHESILEHRWWNIDELKVIKTVPRNLPDLLLSIESSDKIEEIEM